jgi:hypothetical protein
MKEIEILKKCFLGEIDLSKITDEDIDNAIKIVYEKNNQNK